MRVFFSVFFFFSYVVWDEFWKSIQRQSIFQEWWNDSRSSQINGFRWSDQLVSFRKPYEIIQRSKNVKLTSFRWSPNPSQSRGRSGKPTPVPPSRWYPYQITSSRRKWRWLVGFGLRHALIFTPWLIQQGMPMFLVESLCFRFGKPTSTL